MKKALVLLKMLNKVMKFTKYLLPRMPRFTHTTHTSYTHTQKYTCTYNNYGFFLNFIYLRILPYLNSLTVLISSHYILAPIYPQQEVSRKNNALGIRKFKFQLLLYQSCNLLHSSVFSCKTHGVGLSRSFLDILSYGFKTIMVVIKGL